MRKSILLAGMLLRALSLPAIAGTQTGESSLSFILPGDEESGELVLRFEEAGENTTRLHVALDLPAAMRVVDC